MEIPVYNGLVGIGDGDSVMPEIIRSKRGTVGYSKDLLTVRKMFGVGALPSVLSIHVQELREESHSWF